MSIYKSPFLIYGNGFSPKKKILLCIYCSKMKKTHIFRMKFYPKTLNIQIVLDLIYVYQYYTP